jgi:hypothetical protein
MTDEQLAQIGNGITDEELAQIANALIEQYKPEIIRDRDWWHGTDTHSFNIHSPDEDGWFQVNVYKVDPVKGMDDYEWWIDLPRVYLVDEQTQRAELKAKIKELLEDNHPAELARLTGAGETLCHQLVYEIYKDGGLHEPQYWETERVGDIWAIYGKTFAGEYIDANGDFLAFDTEEEANKYIQEEIK